MEMLSILITFFTVTSFHTFASEATAVRKLSARDCSSIISHFRSHPNSTSGIPRDYRETLGGFPHGKGLIRLLQRAKSLPETDRFMGLIEGHENVQALLDHWNGRHISKKFERQAPEIETADDVRSEPIAARRRNWTSASLILSLPVATLGVVSGIGVLPSAGIGAGFALSSILIGSWRFRNGMVANNTVNHVGRSVSENVVTIPAISHFASGRFSLPDLPSIDNKPVEFGFALGHGKKGPFALAMVAASGKKDAAKMESVASSSDKRKSEPNVPKKIAPNLLKITDSVESSGALPFIVPRVNEWISGQRDSNARGLLEKAVSKFSKHGLDGFSDKLFLEQIGVWEIRIHRRPGFRLYCARDSSGRSVLLGIDVKPREGQPDNYKEARNALRTLSEINSALRAR